MEVFSKSDIGKKRTSNQDRVVQDVISDTMAWAAVCDGMGGFNGGDIASETATESIKEFFGNYLKDTLTDEKIREVMYEAAHFANDKIYDLSKRDPNLGKMGTTIVMCVVKNNTAHIIHAGDSRAYLVSSDAISQISVDHSVVQKMIDSGEITPDEAQSHPQKNMITRALGVEPSIALDYKEVNISEDDVIMLCTDGLTNHLSSLEIYEVFKKARKENQKENLAPKSYIEIIPEQLISESNKRGGKDNITVSIISQK
ncbi:MAG: Stp1/IreP family PP2C-type Ser/Thr phosphatase [Acutalibacteraceae bacterium]